MLSSNILLLSAHTQKLGGPLMTPIDLHVPFNEKDAVKALGAKWDAPRRTWYVPSDLTSDAFSRWLPLAPEPRLFVDLVPNTAWFSNLRFELNASEWAAVKNKTYRATNFVCEACGGRGPDHPVECHERWTYVEDARITTSLNTHDCWTIALHDFGDTFEVVWCPEGLS
jgi:hypothetical protein